MLPRSSRSRAELDRLIDNARRLRAESLVAGEVWRAAGLALADALGLAHRRQGTSRKAGTVNA